MMSKQRAAIWYFAGSKFNLTFLRKKKKNKSYEKRLLEKCCFHLHSVQWAHKMILLNFVLLFFFLSSIRMFSLSVWTCAFIIQFIFNYNMKAFDGFCFIRFRFRWQLKQWSIVYLHQLAALYQLFNLKIDSNGMNEILEWRRTGRNNQE